MDSKLFLISIVVIGLMFLSMPAKAFSDDFESYGFGTGTFIGFGGWSGVPPDSLNPTITNAYSFNSNSSGRYVLQSWFAAAGAAQHSVSGSNYWEIDMNFSINGGNYIGTRQQEFRFLDDGATYNSIILKGCVNAVCTAAFSGRKIQVLGSGFAYTPYDVFSDGAIAGYGQSGWLRFKITKTGTDINVKVYNEAGTLLNEQTGAQSVTPGAGTRVVLASQESTGLDIDTARWDNLVANAGPPPNITSWGNTKTNNQTLGVYLHPQEGANFNVTANQAITTYTWKLDNVDQSNNWNNITVAYLGLGNHTLNVTATNANGSDYKNWTINSSYSNPPTSGYDPSGYVLNGTTATCCGIPGAYVNISNSSYAISTYADATGFWNVNIGANGNYDYLVSAQGYTTLTGNQAFTIGGVNNNFTMSPNITGLLKGTVYTYATNVPSTKVVDGDLSDIQQITEQSATAVGGSVPLNFTHDGYTGYRIKMEDVSASGGRSVVVRVYHMDNSCGFQCLRTDLPEVGSSPYVMFEGDTVFIPIHVSAYFDANIYMHVNNIFIGSEQSRIDGNFGIQTTRTGLGQIVSIIEFVVALLNMNTPLSNAILTYDTITFFGTHDNDNPTVVEIDTTKCKTAVGTDGACILASNFNPGASYLSFQASITGQSNEAGFPGKVIFGFSDDAATQFPDANKQDITLDSTMSVRSSDVINMSSVDVDGDNQIKVWLKIPSGYADTIAIKYFYVTFIGGQTPLVPLPGVQVNVYNRTTNALVASTITSSPMGTYSKYVPLGNVSVTYSKNNYFPNTTWLNFTGSANVITNNVILNSTNTTVNQSFDQVDVRPDPSTYTQQINAYFTTLDETCLGFGYILEVRQYGTDLVLQTATIPRLTTSTVPLNTFNPGTYDIIMKGYKTCPTLSRDIVAQNNFTVTTNVPTVHWSSSKYVLGQTMQIQIGVPVTGGAQTVTVIYPNGTLAFNQSFAASNTFYTQTFATNSNRTLNNYPPGLYIANISGGNTAQTYLSNVSTNDYSLSAPDSVGYGQVFNVVYVSPESADLIFSNSDGTYIASVPNIIGNNIVQFDTGLLPKRDTVLTIKIVRDDQIKASVTTSVSISFPGSPDNVDAVAVIDGWTALFNLGINPTSKFLFALIITVIFMLAGALVTGNLGWGTLFGIIPFVFFAFIGYIPLLLSVLIVIAIGLKLRFL